MDIKIEKLKENKIGEAKKLVALVIEDNFRKLNLDLEKLRKEVAEEIASVQIKFDLAKPGAYHFFVAKANNKIVGTAGYGVIGKPVKRALEILKKPENHLVELVSFYIHPLFQSQGIGTKLFKTILATLTQKRRMYQDAYSLSTGWPEAKTFWTKKLGKPTVILPKYYANTDYWIWLKNTRS
ncbi:hypothetical protein A2160_05275 [Candidatus Beckwithbacteria bacterium RBG_13_42_9]|uniref:N-acetyltransferase domain-containing protein n=1 Tax=Candidatus Beckwithbacteria bacterium RBG_13_42_9 TaxID=1797457 RepID=A0A1F5E6P4_9BACT|nr:MAG: hypothetical protein A2160_05275 [Candidatus Beckwithbacteria bacterium RBG_13_42_9]